ncbi:MAG: tetratricopeptide repeat protein [Bacteroidales bacterium]|jgi:tetratricopeptide (TPR) repeat protein|nr:tetratricopeptide repeat protein [Bacteroidales bacterium]
MKCAGIIFLFCICVVTARAQDVDAVLHAADSLSAQPQKAVEILNRALATDPDSEELLKVRAEAYESLKQYDQSVADYKRLTQLSPDEENLWYLLGHSQYKNGQLTDALKSLNRATRLNPKYLPAFHARIQVLLQLNQNDAALKVSDSTLQIGETAKTYYLQGEVYSRLKSWQKAGWAYDKATKIDKGYINAYIALANIAANTNKSQETLEAAESALGIDPDSKEALIARSRGFALSKNYTDAIDDVSYAIKLDPDNVNALYWRGIYYRDTNKPQDAIRDFEKALKLQPDNWQAIAGRADAYARAGDKKTALEGYRKLLVMAADHPEKDAITQLSNQQIFELSREDRAPTLALTDPKPESFDIQVPDNEQSITIKGKISDESPIKSLVINGQTVPVTPVGGDFEFASIVKLENAQEIQIEVSDVYHNINQVVYHLVRNETGKPQIVLFTPKLSESGVITLGANEPTLYIEGKVTDESSIASIVVDGKAVDFDHDAADPAFSAIVDINNKTLFSIAVTDRFGNTTEQTYTLEKLATAVTGTEPAANAPAVVPAVEQASH